MKKVKVCKRCTDFDPKELKAHAKEAGCSLKFGCIGTCKKKHSAPKTAYFGLIDKHLVVCDSPKEFFKEMG